MGSQYSLKCAWLSGCQDQLVFHKIIWDIVLCNYFKLLLHILCIQQKWFTQFFHIININLHDHLLIIKCKVGYFISCILIENVKLSQCTSGVCKMYRVAEVQNSSVCLTGRQIICKANLLLLTNYDQDNCEALL